MSTVLTKPRAAVFPAPAVDRSLSVRSLPRRFSRYGARLFGVTDAAAIAIAFAAGGASAWLMADAHPSFGGIALAAIALAVWFATQERYRQTLAILPRDELYHAAANVLLAAVVVLPVLMILSVTLRTQIAVAIGLLGAGAMCGVARWLLRRFMGDRKIFSREVAVVAGSADGAGDVAISIERSTGAAVHVVPADNGDAQEWMDRVCARFSPTYVVVSDDAPRQGLNVLAQAAARRGVVLAVASRACADALSIAELPIGERTLVAVRLPISVTSGWQRALKRVFDVGIASFVLILTAPLVLLASLAIAVDSGFPIFLRQERVGCGGRLFHLWKLRTMRADAEAKTGPVWTARGDARVTRVGRILRSTSLDELPQLLNVLSGEMSIVGPRPERPNFVERFFSSVPRYDERLLVPPGLTACSHLYMPRAVGSEAVAERLEYDVFYIRHWSLAMDVALVLKTAIEVWTHRAP